MRTAILGIVCAAWLAACGTVAAEPIRAFVSIGPQAFLTDRIGDGRIAVSVLVGPGQNHHTFEPTPRQLAELSDASLYFTIGLPFEQRVVEKVRAANPNLRAIDTRADIALRKMEPADRDADHDHGPAAGAADPHVWLSPMNAKVVATSMAAGLKEADAANAAEYERNLAELQQELDAVHARIAQFLAPFHGAALYVYHPAFGYFADAYGLHQVAVEIEGKEPTAKQLADLITRARQDQVRVIFVQQQFPKKSAEVVAREIGGVVVPIDPLAADYLSNLEDIARKIAAALGSKPQ
jgi:zinc transport system substrate-binding protein